MADDIHTLSRRIAAMHTELTATRKLVERILVDQQQARPEGVRTLDDGSVFLPGTGTLGGTALSDEAQATLTQLDTDRPT